MSRLPSPTSISLTLVACVALALPALAQRPPHREDEAPKNLKVFPRDTDRRTVVQAMRRFSDALGVGCDHCHVEAPAAEGPGGRHEMDFASDEKETKNVARAMMRMVQEINQTELPKTGRKEFRKVACVTCHHGLAEPETIGDAVSAAMDKGGVAAGVARYKELKENYYGSGAYDFSNAMLADVAVSRVIEGKDFEGAMALLKMGLESAPQDPMLHASLAEVLDRKGDHDEALKEMQKAVDLAPDNRRLRFHLERMKAPPGEGMRPRPPGK